MAITTMTTVHVVGPVALGPERPLHSGSTAAPDAASTSGESRWVNTFGELASTTDLAERGCAITVSGDAGLDLASMTAGKLGETVTFKLQLHSSCFTNAEVCISLDGHRVLLHMPVAALPKTTAAMAADQHGGSDIATVSAALTEPGFLRCRVNFVQADGEHRHTLVAVGYAPSEIQPTAYDPPDFNEFWSGEKARLAAVPLGAELTLVPVSEWRKGRGPAGEAFSHPGVGLWSVTLGHVDGERCTGYYAAPLGAAASSAPAVLVLQNHGGGAWPVPMEWAADLAALGFAAFAMQTHDCENGRPVEYYRRLNTVGGPIASYTLRGVLDKDAYYFKRVYLRIVRSLDFLTSRSEWDGKTALLTGRSQGGGLSLVGAGLDPRVTGLVCAVPAMAELGAGRYGRAAGWPRCVSADEHDYGAALTAATLDGHGPVSESAWQVGNYFDAVNLGLDRIVALHHRSSTLYTRSTKIFGAFISEATMRLDPR
jgi:cephalosporin-C deacetylase-like acetyl esterase